MSNEALSFRGTISGVWEILFSGQLVGQLMEPIPGRFQATIGTAKYTGIGGTLENFMDELIEIHRELH